jgi:hypothetical protein
MSSRTSGGGPEEGERFVIGRMACMIVAVAAMAAGRTPAGEGGQAVSRGLYVRDDVLMKGGRAFRGFGVNYFSAFSRTIRDPKDTSYVAGFRTLRGHHIPVVRFMCGGFWPTDWELYRTDREEYFRRLDAFVAAAEAEGIGLIPSLFWHLSTVPDLVGEPMDQLGNVRSKTHAMLRTYIREVVGRYKDSPAIWAWEVGCEYALAADLPNASKHRPKIVPQLGTPKTRSERDDVASKHVATVLAACAKEIRKLDRHRILLSGNALPPAYAWHNSAERSWKSDTEAQFREVLLRDNPDPIDTISIHVYPGVRTGSFADRTVDLGGLLKAAASAAAGAGKPLIVGEFGVGVSKDGAAERAAFEKLLADLEAARPALALLWVFDHSGQNGSWNVTGDNARAYQLELIGKANRRLGVVLPERKGRSKTE